MHLRYRRVCVCARVCACVCVCVCVVELFTCAGVMEHVFSGSVIGDRKNSSY